jgi:hypothetical protein
MFSICSILSSKKNSALRAEVLREKNTLRSRPVFLTQQGWLHQQRRRYL